MKLQRFIHELMLATPFVVMLALGVQARTSPSDFEPYTYSDNLQTRLLAYGDALRYAESKGIRPGHTSSLEMYEVVAAEWVRRAEAGVLKELPAENALDTVRDGVKSEIRSTLINLSNGLNREVRELPDDAIERRLRAFELSNRLHQLIRYNDHYAIGYVAARNQVWLDTLRPFVSKLNANQLQRLEAAVTTSAPDPRRLEAMMRRAERLFVRDGHRWGLERMAVLAPAVSNDNREAFSRQLRQLVIANGDDPAFIKQNGGVLFAQTALGSQNESLADIRRAIRERASQLTEAESK